MTLEGKRILVTRAAHQAEALISEIEAAGGIAVRYPCIDIILPEDIAPLDAALQNIANYDWVLFTSSNTAQSIKARVQALGITINWTALKIGSVGLKTNRTIEESLGTLADFIPKETTGEGLAKELPMLENQRILVPQSTLADNAIADILMERGALVTVVDAYQTVVGSGGADVAALLANKQLDALTFTSGSTVTHFVQRIAPQLAWHIPAVCIGPSTHDIATELGFQHTYYPDDYSISEMVSLLKDLFDEVKNGNT